MKRVCVDGAIRFVPMAASVGPQSSALVERMGNHRRPSHVRPKRTAKAKATK